MAGEFESVGEVVTAGLVAGAVEPETGLHDGRSHETTCLNCATPLTGAYCHACGQRSHLHRSLRTFFTDFLAGSLNFEGKFWRTLPLLAWRPGDLTRRYIDGERARFISPIALYLFTVFLMFAVLNFNGAFDPRGEGVLVLDGLEESLAEERGRLLELEKERGAAIAASRGTRAIDRRIAEQREDIERLEGLKELRQGRAQSGGILDPDTPAWARKAIGKVQSDPEQAVASVQDAASKYSWLLIPLSLPFMWLLFPFSRRFRMYDHSVFVTYSLSFMMLLVILAGLLVPVGWAAAAGFLLFVPPVHMYRQLRGAYRLGWFGALWRSVLLVGFCFTVAGLFAAAMVAIGII